MTIAALDPALVVVLLLNFFILATANIRLIIYGVAVQGVLLGLIYPAAHFFAHPAGTEVSRDALDNLRLALLSIGMVLTKGVIIPQLVLRAMREADVQWKVDSIIGCVPALLIGAVGTTLAMVASRNLPLNPEHASHLLIPSSLATVLTGFLVLTTCRKAVTQVLGYVVLENGIFIFGLLLIQAIPILVELGVLLDLYVGVFVMGIIINHVSRAFPAATDEHLSALKE
jgi:hydrogenase-4 component E